MCSLILLYAGKSDESYATMVTYIHMIPSKNALSADNQQERLNFASWIAGFSDGEGCFSIAVIKNKTTKFGYQIFPEFVVTQGAKSLPALEKIKNFFKCGRIFVNKRYDNHNEYLYRYCVRALSDLDSKIIPFFEKYRLQTYKQNDFLIFKRVVKMMKNKKHLDPQGRKIVIRLIETMNSKKRR